MFWHKRILLISLGALCGLAATPRAGAQDGVFAYPDVGLSLLGGAALTLDTQESGGADQRPVGSVAWSPDHANQERSSLDLNARENRLGLPIAALSISATATVGFGLATMIEAWSDAFCFSPGDSSCRSSSDTRRLRFYAVSTVLMSGAVVASTIWLIRRARRRRAAKRQLALHTRASATGAMLTW